MSAARDKLTDIYGPSSELLRDDLDAYRAEVLAEAADFVDNDDDCDCGGCDSCVPRQYAAAIRHLATAAPTEKASAPAPTATPDTQRALADRAEAVEHRDYWQHEIQLADTRIAAAAPTQKAGANTQGGAS